MISTSSIKYDTLTPEASNKIVWRRLL